MNWANEQLTRAVMSKLNLAAVSGPLAAYLLGTYQNNWHSCSCYHDYCDNQTAVASKYSVCTEVQLYTGHVIFVSSSIV